MRNNAKACLLPMAICALAIAATQPATPPRPTFLPHALIEQKDGRVFVVANDPRPLDQAVGAIRQNYGWLVDYEDPVYTSSELVDDTDPKWREAHPNQKGVTRVAGGTFKTDFVVVDVKTSYLDEERVLNKIVADYNASTNPGEFSVMKETSNRYAVVGVGTKSAEVNNRQLPPILDTEISLPLQERTVGEAFQLIAQALSQKTGYRVALGSAPTNLLIQTKVKDGGTARPARELLTELAMATRFPMVWRCLYDADGGWYFINLEIATETTSNANLR